MQIMWSVVDLLTSKFTRIIPIIVSTHKSCNLYLWNASITSALCFITCLVTSQPDWLVPMLRKVFLFKSCVDVISVWVSKHIILLFPWKNFAGIWSMSGDLCLFNFSITVTISEHWVQSLAAQLYVSRSA